VLVILFLAGIYCCVRAGLPLMLYCRERPGLNSREILSPRMTDRCTVGWHRITGEQPLHNNRYRHIPGSEQQVKVVWHEGPSVAGGPRLAEDLAKPAAKILPIRVPPLNPAAFNPTADNLVQRSGGIDAGSTRRTGVLS
jgi:hypothetical protein